jgi:hypothetical protein
VGLPTNEQVPELTPSCGEALPWSWEAAAAWDGDPWLCMAALRMARKSAWMESNVSVYMLAAGESAGAPAAEQTRWQQQGGKPTS